MRPAIDNATAREHSGEPLSVVGQAGDPSNGLRCSEMAAEREIAELADKATQELRLAWLKLYRKEPPLGLSRDLMIRALANKLQERAYGGANPSMKRRLNTLAGEFESLANGTASAASRAPRSRILGSFRTYRGRAIADINGNPQSISPKSGSGYLPGGDGPPKLRPAHLSCGSHRIAQQ